MSKNIRKITYTAIATAIVFTVTRIIVIPITISTTGSSIYFGDIAIYVISYLLGGPIAALASGIGSALADLTTFPIYAPASLVIKGLMGLTAGYMMMKRKFWIYVMACFIGGAIMVTGYGLYDIILGGLGAALLNITGNLIQWGASVVIAIILYPFAKRILKMIHFEELQA